MLTTGFYQLVHRFLTVGAQVSISWRTGFYQLAHRFLSVGAQVSISWQSVYMI